MPGTTRSCLLYIPELPMRYGSLRPKRLLAGMLGSLHAAGHESRVLDFGSLETMRHLAWRLPGRAAAADPAALVGPLRAELTAHVLKTALEFGPLDFVVFLVEDRAAIAENLEVARALRRMRPELRLVLAGNYAERYGQTLLNAAKCFDAALLDVPESSVVTWAACFHAERCAAQLPNVALLGRQHTPRRAHPDTVVAQPLYVEAVYPAVHAGQFKHFDLPFSRMPAYLAADTCGLHNAALWINSPGRAHAEAAEIALATNSGALHFTGPFTPACDNRDILAEFLDKEPPIAFSRDAHVHHIDCFSVNEWVRAGGRSVRFHVPSGSQRLLEDFYGECFGVSQVETVIRGCRDAGLFTVLHMQFPCPWDDLHTREETLRLLKRARPDGVVFSEPEPLPGGMWYQQAERFGFKLDYKRFGQWACAERDAAYRMRGWNARRCAAERQLIADACAALKIPVGVDAQMALAAQLCGHEGREAEFAARFAASSAAFDTDALGEMMQSFNDGARTRKRAAEQETVLAAFRIAVGN